MSKANEIEKYVLLFLAENTTPQGAGAICSFLNKEKNINLGEATVGRILRKLEDKDLVIKTGFRGRSLSIVGKNYLEKLLSMQDKSESLHHFGQVFFTKAGTYVRDILVARRALGSEAAALAAQNATKDDLEDMEKALLEMATLLHSNQSMAMTDIAFHRAIAKASKNKVLETAMRVIRHGGQDSPIVEKLRNRAGSVIGSDHKKIYLAIKNGESDKARHLMMEHLNNIIKDLDYVEHKKGK